MSEALSGLVQRARGLASLGRSHGHPFSYQWAIPGRNARPVMAAGSVAVAGVAGTQNVVEYLVPFGFRFFLSGVVVQYFGQGWQQGGNDLITRFVVRGASGVRRIQWLNAIRTELGSVQCAPWLLPMALEFTAADAISATLTESGIVPGGDFFTVYVVGYEVPESEMFL